MTSVLKYDPATPGPLEGLCVVDLSPLVAGNLLTACVGDS